MKNIWLAKILESTGAVNVAKLVTVHKKTKKKHLTFHDYRVYSG